ncbi:LacI family DNA-binding transcriptional regulator [Pantoea allii]|uniref:LacI family DNA-binding transcriptional regulator n=1 Tax=Pantoea allii TaxID=574096 RepID=UPI0024B6DA64|nr:LacI family DNA-binding transcriptional regulator [Pantoea allii]MDJ0036778.1 LacI family DNA-binding transcriptional regulator [Pantoea allii]MDJ0042742.1 LacI family DNA-binding transcriptional regulator [Pantoea allii]MDJ0090948.1 LacI family DNA-binding transcriptional regulator [Pantoea allii]
MAGKLRMDEISAETGYSVSTVSRVLSGKSYTSDKAREAIVSCARRLGVLHEMVSSRLLINSLIVFAPARTFTPRGDHFYLEVTRGIAEACATHDVHISYYPLEEQRADVKLFLEKAGAKSNDAIIIIGTDDQAIFNLAATLNKPCVLINSRDKDMKLDAVSPDHHAIGFGAMQHLFEQGHRRVLTVTCLSRETLFLRLEGIKDAYRHFHIPFSPQKDLIVIEAYSSGETEDALNRWLDSHPREAWPDVILPVGKGIITGVQNVLRARSLRIPEDMSLMTTDLASRLAGPPDTSITGFAVPCRELGYEAIQLLQNRLNRPQAPVYNLLLQGILMDGGTVARATRHAARDEIRDEEA